MIIDLSIIIPVYKAKKRLTKQWALFLDRNIKIKDQELKLL